MAGSTRRQFVLRAGALAGALTFAPAAASPAAAGGPPVLTGGRRRVYEALVATVVTQPGLRLDPRCARTAADELAELYTAWPNEERRRADDVLDRLERGPARPFTKLEPAARTAYLHVSSRPASDDPIGAEQERVLLVERAMGLVATTVGAADVPQAITV